MKEILKTGTTVKLASGGPEMTVTSYADAIKRYSCSWFAGNKHESAQFPREALILVKSAEKDENS